MDLLYSHCEPYSFARLIIHLFPSLESHSVPSPEPTLAILFRLGASESCWYRPGPNEPALFQGVRDHTKKFTLNLCPSIYMSSEVFHRVMHQYLTNYSDCEEFNRNYCYEVLRDMIPKVHEIVAVESKKGHQSLRVCVAVALSYDRIFDEFEESSCFNGTGPSSIMQLAERMEIDEDECMNDDCVICFQELGMERKILCLPCSHMFHGRCITKWLEKARSCPICRYEMPLAESGS